ncbi:MAG: nitrous oxide-stimulated promoter family protein [Tenericutes bacterium]|nr:nitrous oxide-stimulated promoter family protein [Mycoplasmatota bacterium]
MIHMYCHSKHKTKGSLCNSCQALLDYAKLRIKKCPYEPEEKPFCSTCPIHCYKSDMRNRVIEVMRATRIRMMFYHPIISFQHTYQTLKNRKKKDE